MTPDLARRRSLLTAALAFALLRKRDGSAPPETEALGSVGAGAGS
jgi:hypothetical protein